MSVGLILAALWALVASVIALLPSRDKHWTSAYVLTAVGIPILGYVTWEHGPWVGLIVLAGGISVLRWPVIHLTRRIARRKQGPSG